MCIGTVWALTQLGHNGVPSLAPYIQQVYAKEEYALFGAMHCYLSFGHQSVPFLVEQNQQVYAEGECITPQCSQSCNQPAGEYKKTLKWYTTMCCYPSLRRQTVNSMAIHNWQV